jgi:hypothetical protein
MSAGFVAIGDSMSIDQYAGGPGRGAASLMHRNRDGDFPDWTGRDLSTAGIGVEVLAQDGATVSDVLMYQLPRLDGVPSLVTITMGGNDLMLAFGDTAAAEAATAKALAVGEAILSRLDAVSRGGGRVVVSTVYDPSDGTGQIAAAGIFWPEAPAMARAQHRTCRPGATPRRGRGRRARTVSRARRQRRRPGTTRRPTRQPATVVLRADRTQRLGRSRDPIHLVAGAPR